MQAMHRGTVDIYRETMKGLHCDGIFASGSPYNRPELPKEEKTYRSFRMAQLLRDVY